MQCAAMGSRRKLTMNWEGLGDDDDDLFFESRDRISAAVSLDLASSAGSSDGDDFEDSRLSFASTISNASSVESNATNDGRGNQASMLASYDMWMSEPGDIKERRKRLLQGMGLGSSREMFRVASTKIARTISRNREKDRASPVKVDTPPRPPPPKPVESASKGVKVNLSQEKVTKSNQPSSAPSHSHPSPIVLGRSRSDSDIDPFSASTKQRREELIGQVSKQRLTRTSSEIVASSIGKSKYLSAMKGSPKGEKDRLSHLHSNASHSAEQDGSIGSFFLIKNLDTGKEFVVKEYNDKGLWNKLSDVQTGKQITMEEFEKSVGQSRLVKELMRRQNNGDGHDGRKFNQHKLLTKSFRNSKRKGAAFLKNIKVAASSKSLSLKEHEHPPAEEQTCNRTPSQWVKARQHGKNYKELTALHVSQEIQAHTGSIWVIRFSKNARFLASAGEDKVIHIWEVQDCEVTKPSDDFNSGNSTPVHQMARTTSDRPQLAEIVPMLKKKSIIHRKKTIPDYVNVPETVFGLSEKPVCTFQGHEDDILDLAWSRTQLLLSSSMDKTVRMWDPETKSCLKTFAHNDYVTCIQFNPVDDNYFISGSLDGKVRIWSTPERHVVDWIDAREMVTAATYTPDGKGAVIGSHQGICRFYSIDDDYKLEHTMDIEMKTKSQTKKLPKFHPQAQAKKITGFQYTPWNPFEVLITSTDARLRIYNGEDLTQKFRGFRNTTSQSSASFSADGKHIICASEDSQVYMWKVADSKNQNGGKKNKITVQAYEHFQSKDVTAAIAWPGSTTDEPPSVEIHSKRHAKLSASSLPSIKSNSPTGEENAVGGSNRKNLPPLPKKNVSSEGISNIEEDEVTHSPPIDPGIGDSNSSRSHSARTYRDSCPISAPAAPQSHSFNSRCLPSGGPAIQATAWGMVIVTSIRSRTHDSRSCGTPSLASTHTHIHVRACVCFA